MPSNGKHLRKGRPYRDHQALPVKLALRRWLLDRMALGDLFVLDACSGSGLIWSALDAHYTIRRWVRTDIEPRDSLTLGLSAEQAIASMDVADFNVIDVDTYG